MRRLLIMLIAGLMLAGGAAAQDGTNPNPLQHHQLHIATSADGLQWSTDGVMLRGHTSVPEVVYWQNKLWIYAVEGDFDPRAGEQERLVILEQTPDGWAEHVVTLDSPFAGIPVDPDVVVLPDGRLRLYFFDFSVMRRASVVATQAGLPGHFYSMVSDDGIHFVLEDGYRLEIAPPATDPDVVLLGDTWWLFGTGGSDDRNTASIIARSDDGLNFEVVAKKIGAVTGTVVLDGGILRQYYCEQGLVVIDESSDALNWTRLEVETGIRGCSPSVTMLPDGSWVMVYMVDPTVTSRTNPPNQPTTGDAQGSVPPSGAGVMFFVVAEAANGPNSFGCGDSLVGVPTGAELVVGDPAANITTALNALLSIKTPTVGQSGLTTALAGSELTVQGVVVAPDGLATVNLSGNLSLSGVCADARVKYQLLATIFASPAVNRALVLVNGQNLAQMLDMSGMAGADTTFTRADIAFTPPSN